MCWCEIHSSDYRHGYKPQEWLNLHVYIYWLILSNTRKKIKLLSSLWKSKYMYLHWPLVPSLVAESPKEGGKEGADDEDGGREKAPEHRAPGPAPSSQPAAGARQERPADWMQPGSPHPSPATAQPDTARCPAGSQKGHQADVSFIISSRRWLIECGNNGLAFFTLQYLLINLMLMSPLCSYSDCFSVEWTNNVTHKTWLPQYLASWFK